MTLNGILERTKYSKYWNKKLHTACIRWIELERLLSGSIRHNFSPFISNQRFINFQHEQEASQAYLEKQSIMNQHGESFSLADIAKRTVSNPEVRRAELMTRIRGCEEFSLDNGDVGEFYTLTLPSEYHACHKRKKKQSYLNATYTKKTPRQGNDFLSLIWSRVRSKLHRQGIVPYGFRIVEPHHDGTPHWHLLLFMPKRHTSLVREAFIEHILKEHPNEAHLDRRFEPISIDPKTGSAVGYIAKYVSKNINGKHIETDKDGTNLSNKPSRIRAWASTWGIRQFQGIGQPSVTLWRFLRANARPMMPIVSQLFDAADKACWKDYMAIQLSEDSGKYEIIRSHEKRINTITGEISTTEKNQFDEPVKAPIIGFKHENTIQISKMHFWRPPKHKLLEMINIPERSEGTFIFSSSNLGLV